MGLGDVPTQSFAPLLVQALQVRVSLCDRNNSYLTTMAGKP